MDYNRLVFMSPIDEEDPSLNFGDLSTSAIRNDNENSPIEHDKKNALQVPIFMDPRIEPTFLEDNEKSYNAQTKQLFGNHSLNFCLSTSATRTDVENSSMKKNPTNKFQAPVFMDPRIEPTFLEDNEKSYNGQTKQLLENQSLIFCSQTSAIRTDVDTMEKNSTNILQAPVFLDSRIDEMKKKFFHELEEKEQKIVRLETKLSAAETEIDSFDQMKKKFPLELEEKQQEIVRLQTKLSAAETEIASFDQMKKKFPLELEEKQQEIVRLQTKLSAAETEIDSFDQMKKKFPLELEEKQQEIVRLQTKLSAADAEIASFDEMKKKFPLELEEKQQEIVRLQTKLSAAETEIASFDQMKKKFPLELEEKQQEIVRLQTKLSAAETEIDSFDQMKKKFPLELEEKQQEIVRLQTKLSAAETEIDSFDQLEEGMLAENFKLQRELLKIKVRFGLITIENAFKALGCCDKEILEEIKAAACQ
ncbi:hypothetical protein niasHS_010174 [Heterodera schachtii]|uniref:Uncharacterized protein n=1 Tax=Heterodera schachtii TaxID=97005 RepID=A0ABD2J4B8_HETSC